MALKLNYIPIDYHLSWSALNLLEKGDKYWVDKYINGKKEYETKYLKFGKAFSQAMQDGFHEDEEVDFIASITPRLERIEEECRTDYKGIELLGYKDSSNDTETYEYKTAVFRTSKGEPSWSQRKAEESGQLSFYGLLDTLMGREINKYTLFWLPTVATKDDIHFTGDIIPYEVKITKPMVNDMKLRVEKALFKINELFKIYGERN
jgi:hypothetical protein